MKNPTRPDSSPIRVEHINFDPVTYHNPPSKPRQKSQMKPFGRDYYGRPDVSNADHKFAEEDKGITEALKKDLSNKGL